MYLSEDYTFCHRFRAIGGKVWLDTRSRIRHVGSMEFAGSPSVHPLIAAVGVIPCAGMTEQRFRSPLGAPRGRRCVGGEALPGRAGASSPFPSTSTSSRPIPSATRATRAGTCAMSSTTSGPPRSSARGASSPAGTSSICRGSRRGNAAGALVGQEPVQAEVYRALANFAREGRPNRLVLLHGPNGSAKSTLAGCIMRALERYSLLDEGALYRFNWVFPSSKTVKGALGFGEERNRVEVASYAHLPDDQIDAKLLVEVRDHPLFLLPVDDRRRLLERLYGEAKSQRAARGLDPPRAALAQEPAGLRGAPRELRWLVQRGAQARAGGALLHLAALPHRRGHPRSADERRRGRAADHRRPQPRRAPRVAPGDHLVRGEGGAHRGGRRGSSSSAICSSGRSTPSSTSSSPWRRARSRSRSRTCS